MLLKVSRVSLDNAWHNCLYHQWPAGKGPAWSRACDPIFLGLAKDAKSG